MHRTRRDPEQIYRDVMAKFDPQARDRIQGVIIDYGVEKADPFFLVFLAMGHLLSLVEAAPENWKALFDEFKGDLDAWTTQNLRTLEAINQQSLVSERLIKSFQELSSLTAKSSEGTLRLKADLTRLTSELEAFKRSWEASASRIESSNLSLAKLFKGMEKRIVQLEGMLTWVWIFSVATLLAVVVMSSFTYWQLAKEANFTHRLLVDEREKSSWLLAKANRAECWYGIKVQSDPQCQ